MNLRRETLRLIERADWQAINIDVMCAEIGCSRRWFDKFRAGESGNSGVDTVQALHDYLRARTSRRSRRAAAA